MNAMLTKLWEYIRGRKQDYMLTFPRNSIAAQRVLQDLAVFCKANETVFNESQRKTDVLIGRQEVWRRIQDYLNLSSSDLYRLSSGQQLDFTEEDKT